LPLRQLYITGRGQDRSRWLTEDELKETLTAEEFDPKPLSDEELLTALDSWSPNIRAKAVDEIAGRESYKALLPKLYDMAKDTGRSRISRAHACSLVAKTHDKKSADILVGLLQDKDSWVRYAAAFSLRTMPTPIKKTYVNELLKAAISMGRPTFPLDPDDPLQQAQGEVSMLLFYDGNAYGPRGVIHNGIDGVDRELLLQCRISRRWKLCRPPRASSRRAMASAPRKAAPSGRRRSIAN